MKKYKEQSILGKAFKRTNMNNKLKCIICGSLVTIFFMVNNCPICGKCLSHIKKNPDIIEIKSLIKLGKPNYVSGINTTATIVTDSIMDVIFRVTQNS